MSYLLLLLLVIPLVGALIGAALPNAGTAKAWALLQGRDYVIPEDVKSIGPDVLRHRIILTYEAEAQAVTTEWFGPFRP